MKILIEESVLRQALEALERFHQEKDDELDGRATYEVITDLRTALDAAEKVDDQLNQARADALREAAENIKRLIGGDGEIWVHEVDGLLSRMAAEIEGKKK